MTESKPHITPDKIGRLVQTARLWLDEVYGDTSQSALDEIEQAFTSLFEQLEAAREALFQCYVASGSDTDGARKLSDMGRIDPPIEVLAVRAVEELRRDYEEEAIVPELATALGLDDAELPPAPNPATEPKP